MFSFKKEVYGRTYKRREVLTQKQNWIKSRIDRFLALKDPEEQYRLSTRHDTGFKIGRRDFSEMSIGFLYIQITSRETLAKHT